MKNQILILAITFFTVAINAQQPVPNSNSGKGVSPLITHSSDLRSSSTYAVVVGISDYQDPGIPDLRFADKDAEAFANYLRSNAGGKLDDDHLKILINQQATMAQFANALDWLMEYAKEGDQAIIYFSGHGDVEKKTLTQPGFLLCWDSPARVYMAGGAFALPMLQEVISTLSIQIKAKVIVITDACRSGTLAGSSVGGAQATAANLAKQFGNEIKIMSCQPNEYSIEGEQWGGGRGAFSYHLLDALYGMADSNDDQWVTLQEVGRYLEDQVTREVAPISQVPMIIGNRMERLTTVDHTVLASIKSGKTEQMAMLTFIESKGMEEDILSKVNTNINQLYQLFKTALKNKIFLEPVNACADSYYSQLIQESQLEGLHSAMRRNYAAALQDDAQQVLNKWLKTDVSETTLSKKSREDKYQAYPRYLKRAAELLGVDHYMYPFMMARVHFFEGYLISLSSKNPNTIKGENALTQFRLALQWQPELPQAYWQMSYVYGFHLLQADSAELYTKKAIELQPAWILPYSNIAFLFSERFKLFERSKQYLDIAMKLDSNSAIVWNNFGNYYRSRKEYVAAEQNYQKAIQLDPNLPFPYSNLGLVYRYTHRLEGGVKQLKKAIELDSTNANTYNTMGMIYLESKHYEESEHYLRKAIQFDSTLVYSYVNLGLICSYTNRYTESEEYYIKAFKLDSTNASLNYNFACLYSIQKKFDKAVEYLEKNFQLGDDDYDYLMNDKDLTLLRENKEQWNALMKKYFPEKIKN